MTSFLNNNKPTQGLVNQSAFTLSKIQKTSIHLNIRVAMSEKKCAGNRTVFQFSILEKFF